jgi:hypothetical protein
MPHDSAGTNTEEKSATASIERNSANTYTYDIADNTTVNTACINKSILFSLKLHQEALPGNDPPGYLHHQVNRLYSKPPPLV